MFRILRSKPVENQYEQLQKLSYKELVIFRAKLAEQNGMLGKIPLIMSTTPVVFLIFGSHVTKYLTTKNLLWLWFLLASITMIVWSLQYHFHKKGQTQRALYLVDAILKEKSSTPS